MPTAACLLTWFAMFSFITASMVFILHTLARCITAAAATVRKGIIGALGLVMVFSHLIWTGSPVY